MASAPHRVRRPVIFILRFLNDNKCETLFALLIAVALLSGVFTYGSDDLKYGPAVIGTFLASLLLIARGYRARSLSFPVTATTLLLCAFFGYVLLSTTWAVVHYTAIYFALIFMLIPLLFFAVVCTGQPERTLRFALGGAGVVIAGVMVWDLIQFFFIYGAQHGARVKHPFLDPNNLAVFMNMAFIPLLALSFRHQPRRDRLILAGLTLLFFIALLATNSRMALVGAAIAFVVMMPVVIRQTRHPTVTALGLIAAAAVIIVAANHYMNGSLFFFMRDIFNFEKSASMTERMALWMSSIRIFQDHFWLGTGLASFFFFYPQYRQPDDSSDGYFTHMDPLQIGLETGIGGYILIYALLIAVLCRTVRVMRQKHLTGADRLLILAPFCGLLTVCIHMHMTFCLYLPAIGIPAAILLAWWYVVTQRYIADPALDIAGPRGRAFSAVFMVMMIWGMLWAAQATAGIYFNTKVAVAADQGDLATARSYLKWQYRLSPASFYRPYEREAEIAVIELSRLRGGDVATRQRVLDRGLFAIDQAIARQPRHGSLRNQRAIMLYLAGDDARPGAYEEAITILRGILRTDPMMIDARMGLANLLRERGDFAMALRVMEEGMIWPRPKGLPDLNYIAMAAQLNQLMGNKQRHDQLVNFALERARMYGFTVAPPPAP